MLTSATTENASLISHASTSAALSPALESARVAAVAGAVEYQSASCADASAVSCVELALRAAQAECARARRLP